MTEKRGEKQNVGFIQLNRPKALLCVISLWLNYKMLWMSLKLTAILVPLLSQAARELLRVTTMNHYFLIPG